MSAAYHRVETAHGYPLDEVVSALHGLSTGDIERPGYVAVLVFTFGAHVDQIGNVIFGRWVDEFASRNPRNPLLGGNPQRDLSGLPAALIGCNRRPPGRRRFQFQSCQ